MAVEQLYQGSKDVFLVGVRADFDAVEDQALKSMKALKDWSILGSSGDTKSLFTQVSNITSSGDRAVWRSVGATGVQKLGNRAAGQPYPAAQFLRGYETEVTDPNDQWAVEFTVPEERDAKEAAEYKQVLNRAQKLLYSIDRQNMADIFELWNLAFTAPTSYPDKFFVKGNRGLDGNYTALGEYLISIQHALASGLTTISNAVQSSGNAAAFSDPNYYASKEQGGTIVDDVNLPMPMFGGKTTLIVPPANGLPRLAMEINGSEWKTDTALNDINALQGLLGQVKTSPYLLKSFYIAGVANKTAWFMVDEEVRDPEVGTGLVQVGFVPLQTKTERREAIDAIVYKVKEQYSYGWNDWRNIMGSNGTGTAYTN